MHKKILSRFVLIFFVTFISGCSDKPSLLLGVTTTLEDSGILAELITAFEVEHEITVKPVIAGSGQIHQLIVRGDIDTAITHDPKGEEHLLSEKSIQSRTPLMSNDYLIVGPGNDPAHIKLAIEPDEAFEKILNVGQTLISRNDQSGTHQMETKWLERSNIFNKDRKIIQTGTGMGASLALAAEKKAYVLVDRGTWLNFSEKKSLKALFEDPEYLPNHYSILSFSKNSSTKNKTNLWEQWLQKDVAQNIILNYKINNQPVFFKSP